MHWLSIFLWSQLFGMSKDELLLGRYCIYLTTHVAGEVISGKTLTQDIRREVGRMESSMVDGVILLTIVDLVGMVKRT